MTNIEKKSNELTIEQILKDLFQQQSATEWKDSLWRLFIYAISNDDLDESNGKYRSELAFDYKYLSDLIDKLEDLQINKQLEEIENEEWEEPENLDDYKFNVGEN